MRRLLLAAAVSLSSTLSSTVALAAGSVADVPARADATADVDARFVDGSGRPIVDVIDGSIITLEIELAEPVTESARYHAHLLPQDVEVAACAVGPGSATCSAGPIDTLGWAWSDLGELLPIRRLELRSTRRAPLPLLLNVAPRPVVLVHGFTSSAAAWDAYVGPD